MAFLSSIKKGIKKVGGAIKEIGETVFATPSKPSLLQPQARRIAAGKPKPKISDIGKKITGGLEKADVFVGENLPNLQDPFGGTSFEGESAFTAPFEAAERVGEKLGIEGGPQISGEILHGLGAGILFGPFMSTAGVSDDVAQQLKVASGKGFKLPKSPIKTVFKPTGVATKTQINTLAKQQGISKERAATLLNREFLKKGIRDITTTKAVDGFLTKTVTFLKKPAFIIPVLTTLLVGGISASLGGKVFGKFLGQEEAGQMAGFPKYKSYEIGQETGDWSIYEEVRSLEKNVYEDDTFWETIKSFIPWLNVKEGLDDFRDTAIVSGEIWDKIAEDTKIQQQTGLSDEDMWKVINEERAAEERALIDYYNKQFVERKIWENKTDAQIREDIRKEQEEDREAIAAFWLNYYKEKAKLQDNTRPSNLNFGLL